MRFGVLYNIDYHEDVHGSASNYYGAILDQAVILEELGYDSVWFGEHHRSGPSALESFFGPVFLLFVSDGVEHARHQWTHVEKACGSVCRDQHFADRPDQWRGSRNATHAFR